MTKPYTSTGNNHFTRLNLFQNSELEKPYSSDSCVKLIRQHYQKPRCSFSYKYAEYWARYIHQWSPVFRCVRDYAEYWHRCIVPIFNLTIALQSSHDSPPPPPLRGYNIICNNKGSPINIMYFFSIARNYLSLIAVNHTNFQ